MAHPLHHAESSARKFGGIPADYQEIHNWFDASKAHMAFFTHRALRHHTQGIFEAERVFGLAVTNSAGRVIPLRWIGEQHVKEDCRGKVPSVSDWLGRIQPEAWMANGHIDAAFVPIVGDPRAAWVKAVTQQSTILGFENWFELHVHMQSVHGGLILQPPFPSIHLQNPPRPFGLRRFLCFSH